MRFIVPFLVLSLAAFGQQDTMRHDTTIVKSLDLKRITIPNLESIRIVIPLRYKFVYRRDDIDALQPVDLGDMLQHSAGVNIKSYGGLGGLKSVSIKGLGSQHVGVVKDGFAIRNLQTGQINLAQIHTDEIEMMYDSDYGFNDIRLPVSAVVQGNFIGINTFSAYKGYYPYQVRANVRGGSFGLYDTYAGVKRNFNNLFLSTFIKVRGAQNNYGYSFENGNQRVEGLRANNKYFDANWGFSFGGENEKNLYYRILYSGTKIEQQLPGAVILYNETADELLTTDNHVINADLTKAINNSHFRVYSGYNYQRLFYRDPSYLNSAGELNATYINQYSNLGLNYLWKNSPRKYEFKAGIEYGVGLLRSIEGNVPNPIRNQLQSYIGGRRYFSKSNLSVQLSSQFIGDVTTVNKKNYLSLNPQVAYNIEERGKRRWEQTFEYKSTYRMPTFNELYYNNIGNVELEPEKTEQFTYRNTFQLNIRVPVYFKADVYSNIVRDKIVAIPTKNLFTWSMQNVGQVFSFGSSVSLKTKLYVGTRQHVLDLDANYTYQKSVDITEKDSPTYFHQIAYTPEHSANFSLSYNYKQLGLRVSNQFISYRYVLNENIDANLIDGFLLTDLAVFYQPQFLSYKQKMKVQFTVKNIFNQSYSVIQSYVMPGRNYLITLSYALH